MSNKVKTVSYQCWKQTGDNYTPSAAACGIFLKEIERNKTPREEAGLISVREGGELKFFWAIDGRPYHAGEHVYDIDVNP